MKIRWRLFLVLSAGCIFLMSAGIVIDGFAGTQVKKESRPGVYNGYSPQIYTEVVRSSRYIQIRGNSLAMDMYRPAKNGVAVSKPHPVIFSEYAIPKEKRYRN